MSKDKEIILSSEDVAKSRRAPCAECPFRRAAIRGYVGGHERAQEIADIVLSEKKFPCHMEVSAEMEGGSDFVEAVSLVDHCAGALAVLSNQCKLPHDRNLAALRRHVGQRPDCFGSMREFVSYHDEEEGKR